MEILEYWISIYRYEEKLNQLQHTAVLVPAGDRELQATLKGRNHSERNNAQ